MPVTINCDMGEAFGIYGLGDDEACMPYVTHANVACGFHASDPSVMWRTVRAAKRHGVNIGSHPGLPDREEFGRREMRMSRDEVAAPVLYQTGALQAFTDAEGTPLSHIKPHGALFGMAQRDEAVSHGIADAAFALGLPVIAYSNCAMSRVFAERGVTFTCEFYSDLDYTDEGWQIITMKHDPVTPEAAADKVRRAVEEGFDQVDRRQRRCGCCPVDLRPQRYSRGGGRGKSRACGTQGLAAAGRIDRFRLMPAWRLEA